MPNPYSYRIKVISPETRTLLNFWKLMYEILFNDQIEAISSDKEYTENLVNMLNIAYNHGLNGE